MVCFFAGKASNGSKKLNEGFDFSSLITCAGSVIDVQFKHSLWSPTFLVNSNSEEESVLAGLIVVLLHFSCLRCKPLLKAASYNLLKVGALAYGIYVAGLKKLWVCAVYDFTAGADLSKGSGSPKRKLG